MNYFSIDGGNNCYNAIDLRHGYYPKNFEQEVWNKRELIINSAPPALDIEECTNPSMFIFLIATLLDIMWMRDGSNIIVL